MHGKIDFIILRISASYARFDHTHSTKRAVELISKFHTRGCNLSREHHLYPGIGPRGESVEVLSGGGARELCEEREKRVDWFIVRNGFRGEEATTGSVGFD